MHGVVFFGAAILAMFGGMTCTAVAGDLLRGGYTDSGGSASTPGSFTPPSLAKAQQNAKDVLARTSAAINAVNAMQSAARKLATASGANNLGSNPNNPSQTLPNVPNGLGLGGLNPVGGATPMTTGAGYDVPTGWTGVGSLSQTQTGAQTTVDIGQDKPDAVLYWTTFNVGKQTTLQFNQNKTSATAATSIAFNIIQDPSMAPSQILGSIEAPGQVYVINQNGIIFGGASQVNVHTLVASSLPIDTYYITQGLLNNPDDQFLFSAISQPAGTNGSPAFTPPTDHTGPDGEVLVQPGARITAPANAASVGGRVALIGPEVDNQGTISTPDGQTILAAGLQVAFVASSAATLRGLDVYVGAVSDAENPTSGEVTNSGLIIVPRGDAYLVGETVDQNGSILSTTSVTLNGEIDLIASYNDASGGGVAGVAPYLPQATGAVEMGPDSVTEILPELNSADTVVLSGFTLSSVVNIQGKTIHMEGDSTLLAPGATGGEGGVGVSLDAGTWNYFSEGGNASDSFVNAGGQIYLDSGAVIDAAGSADVSASVLQNIIPVQLLGPELADSPSQRAGVLMGQTIMVDIRNTGTYNGIPWVGTPLVDDVSSFVALIPFTIGELTINGGTVSMTAGASVVMQPGSQVNVSGGWIDYQGGIVSTSEVISGGNVYPISGANPDLVYQGFNLGTFSVAHPTYGINETYTDPILDLSHYEDSYISGGNGGSVSITAAAVALNGQLLGNTEAGPRQRSIIAGTPNSLISSSLPAPSTLALAFQEQTVVNTLVSESSPTPPHVIISSNIAELQAGPFSVDASGDPAALPVACEDEVVLSSGLFTTDGFGSLQVSDQDGNVTLPEGVSLNLGPGGSISIGAANIDIGGSIIAPEGSLNFTTYNYSPFAPAPVTTPPINPDRGHFTLGAGALLSTAGTVVDDREFAPGADTAPLTTSGGSISIKSYSADLSAGGVIDVSGGVEMQSSGKPAYGNAGSITIAAARDPALTYLLGGSLVLHSTLEGFSGANGGKLSIGGQFVQVGGASSNPLTQVFAPDFFDQGGFESFTLSGFGGLTIESGIVLGPVVTSLVVIPGQPGDPIQLNPEVLDLGVRPPVSLSFKAPGVTNPLNGTLDYQGNLVLGNGASITTDPRGSVSLSGGTVAVLGSITAPGGQISISGANSTSAVFPGASTALATVDLGPDSVLSTAGVTLLTANAYGYRTGSVLNGGSISISGNIVAEAGSVMNVSGASGILDLTPAQADATALTGGDTSVGQAGPYAGLELVPTQVFSNGGSITLEGAEELFTDATLIGAAGGPSAVGGSLSIASGRFSTTGLPTDPTLTVTQAGPVIPARFYPAGGDAIGREVVDSQKNPIIPMGHIAVDSFNRGGFANLNLAGSVQFSGPVSIDLPGSISVATTGVIFADAAVNLTANYVALGLAFEAPTQPQFQHAPFQNGSLPYYFNPTTGTGDLTVRANLIDIGSLSLQGIARANFIANGGDIRGDGTLDVQGAVLLQAGQVYPPTETTFTVAAYDYSGNVEVADSSNGSTTVTLASGPQPVAFGVGSSLLGSTVVSIDRATDTVTLAAGADATITAPTQEAFVAPGTVTIKGVGQRQLPLSAGGTLNIYATDIVQDGVLRAPFGGINLGWDGSGTSPVDPISGAGILTSGGVASAPGALPLPVTSTVDLKSGSITSASAVDPATGQALIIPYGTNPDGTSWIDPSGLDITAGGAPQKSISISALNVNDEHGSVIDIKGGGDLLAAQFIPGIGGNNDTLASTTSFAIVPGYQATYAPFDTDAGYNNAALVAGDRVYLNASNGLPAGTYTLLPARYALVPGAFLVTPQSGLPIGSSQVLPDGGNLVSGYRFGAGQTAAPLTTNFEVDSGAVIDTLASYTVYSGNSFLAAGAVLNNQQIPRLPRDSGQVSFQAIDSLAISGNVQAAPLSTGLGGIVDISSSPAVNIVIAATPGGTAPAGTLVLTAPELNTFDAATLLIGGTIVTGASGDSVAVSTDNITVDPGATLKGQDIILAANDNLTVDQGVEILSTGAATGAPDLTLDGDGALLRVSADPDATITRTHVTAGSTAELTIGMSGGTGADPIISGESVTLDSSGGTSLDPAATIHAKSVALNSGQITLELTNPGSVATPTGLVLSGPALQGLFGSAESLSLLSYTSINIYGTGTLGALDTNGQAVLKNLALSAGEITGANSVGGSVVFNSQNILLENADNTPDPGAGASTGGALEFNGDTIVFGANTLAIDQFAAVDLNASGGMIAKAASGTLTAQGVLTLTAPVITGAAGVTETISTPGALTLTAPAGTTAASVSGGLGATLDFSGATVTVNTNVTAHSGGITLHATTGALTVGNLAPANLDTSGQARTFFNLTRYTNGGQINLIADQGAVDLGADSTINVAYNTTVQAGGVGGNAGTLAISAPQGSATLLGTLIGQGGAGASNGSFSLDAGTIPATTVGSVNYAQGNLDLINAALDAGGFTQSISVTDENDASVTIGSATLSSEPTVTAAAYTVTANQGSITVYGTINAAAVASTDSTGNAIAIGGTIVLQAAGNVTLANGSTVTVAAQNYSNSQRGGAISLEAGSDINGIASSTAYVNIDAGSTINLSVAATPVAGDLGGTLLLRAPQIGGQSSPTGVQVGAIDGTIIGSNNSAAPVAINVAGYAIFNAGTDGSQGSIDNEEASVAANGSAFANSTGSFTVSGNTVQGTGIEGGLLSGNVALANSITSGATLLTLLPGAEIIDQTGSLTLSNTWDLAASGDRFGPDKVAGVLTLRAADNIVFDYLASLSDGFVAPSNSTNLWDAALMPVGSRSWSYQITSGANFSSANVAAVESPAALALMAPADTGATGSVLVGDGAPALPMDQENQRKGVIPSYYQTIRTGAGSIAINAGADVQLLDSLATIYSAGAQAPALAGFTPPTVSYPNNSNLIPPQLPFYPAQYTEHGGDVTIVAQNDIAHYIDTGSGVIADSSLELPNNWLYRQGSINPLTSNFAKATSWWSDFSNFFEGVGAFGGGNVTLSAGNNITNVDAAIPTNARMLNGAPNATSLVQLGGGNLMVAAGNDISGGVYYVESGQGTITAGGQILTNSTRANVDEGQATYDQSINLVPDPSTWLPTTLFAGVASFNVSAGRGVLLGSVANPFLLPPGINNGYPNLSFFSTFATTDQVNVESLSGDVTIKSAPVGSAAASLQNWLFNMDAEGEDTTSYAAMSEPWLSLAVETVDTFASTADLLPPVLRTTAFSGSINVVGTLEITPSPTGTLELLAAGSINGLQVNQLDPSTNLYDWATSLVNLSDANPASLPGITTPLSANNPDLPFGLFDGLNALFAETGSVEGAAAVIQVKEALHDPGLLHKNDSTPADVYAGDGSISGITLFTPKFTKVIASQNITDASFYIQNLNTADISVVSAGTDLIPYDPNSPLRLEAQTGGNELYGSVDGGDTVPATGSPDAGDIQISGPGTIEVLAGRDLTLGVGSNNSDGTAVGITSIGNQRDPYLPVTGAQIVAAAGLGGAAAGLNDSSLDITAFVSQIMEGPDAATYFSDLAAAEPSLGITSLADFKKLTAGQQALAALDLFYLVLRDSGRDHNLVGNAGYGNYAAGYAAIHALLPSTSAIAGNIDITSKEITTETGGDINLFDPTGQITVGVNLAGAQPVAQGVFTDDGGNISIYTQQSVNIGTSRIFTLQGGNIIIWSSKGNIDAGNSSKTVQSAPPTRVLVDPQSANVETDLAGLATGGGIGVLATVVGVPPGDVDLIAPTGIIDAGNAGIRATGNLSLAAVQILNASNIQAGGATSGVPTVSVATPNLAGLSAASSAAGAGSAAANQQAANQTQEEAASAGGDSTITVSVIGYGGGDDSADSGG